MIDYDELIAKFRRGGPVKLEAAHELIMSVYGYIKYLTDKYHSYLFMYYLDDIIPYCHLYLLERIYSFDPDRCRFITWSRHHILNSLAEFYSKYIKTVTTSRAVDYKKNINLYIGVPDRLNQDNTTIENDILLYEKLKSEILTEYPTIDWELFEDYFYEGLSLRQLAKKYNYNSRQAVDSHIQKVLRFIRNTPKIIKILEEMR